MATEAQIMANRRNAKKSTGPLTTKGKAVVSQNAVTHGLSAQKAVISSESQEDFDHHRERILDELIPDSPMQKMLAEHIVLHSWRLKRLTIIQNQTIEELNKKHNTLSSVDKFLLSKKSPNNDSSPNPDSDLGRMAIKDFSGARVLDRLLMYERRLEHSLHRTILEFQRLQLMKKINTESEMQISKLAI
ncbi:MAG: hypothetical protein GY774_40915 [Planctomycetes bacterium]|nr:hypothetical protein [Planctomycetota bacterium]